MHQVVHQQNFVVLARGTELPALQGIPHGDVQGYPSGRRGCPAHCHPAPDQGAQHGEETPIVVFDRRAVGAVRCDVGVLVEQVLPRDAHMVEQDPPVVYTG